jgi:hypothetical protein
VTLAEGTEAGVFCHLHETALFPTIGGRKVYGQVASLLKEIGQEESDLIEAFVNEIVAHQFVEKVL